MSLTLKFRNSGSLESCRRMNGISPFGGRPARRSSVARIGNVGSSNDARVRLNPRKAIFISWAREAIVRLGGGGECTWAFSNSAKQSFADLRHVEQILIGLAVRSVAVPADWREVVRSIEFETRSKFVLSVILGEICGFRCPWNDVINVGIAELQRPAAPVALALPSKQQHEPQNRVVRTFAILHGGRCHCSYSAG